MFSSWERGKPLAGNSGKQAADDELFVACSVMMGWRFGEGVWQLWTVAAVISVMHG
jgi:hypothetical protein